MISCVVFSGRKFYVCRFLEKTLSEWLELFEKSNKVPYGPINNVKGVFENEQVC
jgi:crotonobetainyl-CoA:carnitine CoA-transferase CaiB-like acyl-CoA transferase